ncbi:hypothetical protein BH11ACT6_BH11ACT6_12840 [soil metagenome]
MTLRDRLIGAWELVTYTEQELPDGPLAYPHGEDPLGLIMYTPDGYMSAQIETRNRPPYDRPAAAGGTAEQRATAAAGYLAYSGPYFVDEYTGNIRHHVAISLLPNWIDSIQVRRSRLIGDQLVLSAEGRSPDSSGDVLSTLHWTRAHPPTQR